MKNNKLILELFKKFKQLSKDQTKEFKSKIKIPKLEKLTTFKTNEFFSKIKIPNFKNAQESLENKIKGMNDEVLLKESNYWAKLLSWSLTGGTAFGIGWLTIAQTEEIIIATGKLETIARIAEVKMPLQGVAKEILVREGELVEKGQVLIRLDTEVSKAKVNSLQKNLKVSRDILNKLEFLLEEGAVSEVQYLDQLNKISQLEGNLVENEVILKYQEIKSPIAGKVFDLKPWGSGYVAQSSEPIAKIVPEDNLIAKVEIESRNIGFIKLGKQADISIDSFPATDFGVVSGKVSRIGSDALPPNPSLGKGYRFPANIKLDNQTLNLKTGQTLKLVPGMSLTANIKLRKVSYMQLLLGTFKSKASALREM